MGACAGKHANIKRNNINDSYLPVPVKRDKIKDELIGKFRESQQNSENNNTNANRIYRMSYMSADFDKNSFDFSDDVCELILNYLSLEDKLRFECVNKQFQRLIYNRVFDLVYPLDLKVFNPAFDQQKRCLYSKRVLRKCHFVKRLKLTPICCSNVLSLLANNCLNLQSIDLRFDNLKPIRREILSQFADNCGLSLEEFRIRELSDDKFNSESGLALLIVYSEYLTKIEKLNLGIDSDNCLKYFTLFTDIYSERITLLELRLKISSSYTHLNETFELISRFSRLKHIQLTLECTTPSGLELDFGFGAELLAKNCLKLQTIALELRGAIRSPDAELLNSFEHFFGLKSLSLRIRTTGVKLGSIKALQTLRQLSELNILYKNLTDEHFADIHIYCPKLESLVLQTMEKLSNRTLIYLSELGHSLQKLQIFCTPYLVYDITDSGICQLISNCRKLRRIRFECGIRLTQLTFLTLNASADSSPLNRFRFEFCWQRSEEQTQAFDRSRRISAREIWPELKCLPDNLTIVSREYFVGNCGTNMMSEVSSYEKMFVWPERELLNGINLVLDKSF